MKGFMEEFKDFISKGNVMDMAVGVIIGGAFGKIVSSLVENILLEFYLAALIFLIWAQRLEMLKLNTVYFCNPFLIFWLSHLLFLLWSNKSQRLLTNLKKRKKKLSLQKRCALSASQLLPLMLLDVHTAHLN